MRVMEFSATDSVLGYFYQVRLALLSSLQRLAADTSFAVYLETLDDVVFDTTGSPLELLQLKHRCERSANLTNASPDLWKSFRVWIEGRSRGTIPPEARLFLMTTSEVGSDSAASKLGVIDRDEAEALKQLSHTASTSTSVANRIAYNLYLRLSELERLALLKTVIVISAAPSISRVGVKIRDEARLTVRREHLDSFVKRLEAWWFDRVLQHLMDESSLPINSSELESEWHDIQEQFKVDSLPIDSDVLREEVEANDYEDALFVHQVQLTGIGRKRILAAIRDYFRAFTQRSRWVREDLLLVGELDRYEGSLREEWEIQFNRVTDAIDDNALEPEKCLAGQTVYAWMEDSSYPIRPQVQHPSLTRGSLHILANALKVGWHPDFEQRLRHLLKHEDAS